LTDLKYTYRPDIRDRATLEDNFRWHFETLNHVHLTDDEFKRLLDEIISPDVFTVATLLREINSFTRDDGTPLNYTIVNIRDWCKNTFEIASQLRINTDYSFQRYDVMLLINGIPAVQIELKTLGISPRRAMRQIVDYKKDPGNGYIWHTTGSGKTLTSFKASTLLKLNPDIHKCLFVVDRKDLDRQTREEFNRFQEGCVEENTNTAALVRRLVSDDYADKVIVTTIQKLGLALDETSTYNKPGKKNGTKNGKATFKDRLTLLRDKRMVFIFDECHRSQFGQTHQTIKNFFPRAQLFGFTGTPIFPENATVRQIDGDIATLRTTEDLFQSELHAYTITHAIEDKNVLRFHVDYFKPDGENPPRPGETPAKRAVVNAILDKHDAATGRRRFNALLATASINDAIEYYALFKQIQAERQAGDPDFVPLKVSAVFSPPAEGNPDVKQLQEDLPQELADNQEEPDKKKDALEAIIADYNDRYATNHSVGEFDAYYQDVQKRIKDQQYPNRDLPGKGAEKIDITIVVDMLLTGFDSKYLNTLYVDKNLKHHGLIQAFSRTNRVLNAAKPYGHILDFRGQQDRVDEAITLFSGVRAERAKAIWLVDEAPVVIEQLKAARRKMDDFLQSHGLDARPEAVPNLRGDDARIAFIKQFKEVQRLATQLDQYTDLTDTQKQEIEQILSTDDERAFRGVYLETARRLKATQYTTGSDTFGIDGQAREPSDEYGSDSHKEAIDQLDFEFVLFASADIDYDYIMNLISRFSGQTPAQQEMSREQLIRLIRSDAKFMDELEEITEYVRTLETGKALTEEEVRHGYLRFKDECHAAELAAVADKYGLTDEALKTFVDGILDRMIFDGERLTDLMEPLNLGWRERREKELSLMDDLVPLLKKRAGGRTISGLSAYEQ
jgi:type I restriction enzyme R subunit